MGAPDGLSLMASTSSAAIDVNSPATSGNHSYQVNIRIMIAAIVVLFTVILFILSLHLYARWFWKNSQLAARRRRVAQLQQIHEIQQQIQAADDDHFYHFRHPDGYNPHLFASSAAIGLDKELIDKLPLFVFDGGESDNKQPDDLCCAVCLCEFQKGDRARMLPGCGHSFHTDCIDVWLHCHSTCPLCRQSLVLDDEVESHVLKSSGGSLLLLPCSPIVADLDHLIILSSDLQDGSSSSTSSAAAAAVSLVSESSDNLQEQLHQIQLVLESGEATKSSSSKSSSSSSSSTSAKNRWRNLRRLLGLPNSSQLCESTSTSTAATVAASSSGSSPV